ncbi:hypothetical protein OUZ56_002629 [Daphnia magna]|uniref:MARVEL domain-containing protein n=2 Tax=Daphnia magna TaxID=35525 RepID=A0ABR0A6A3_9CRUS|nr:hypothetical protein OUZ56_002629 [Daphnia magna]
MQMPTGTCVQASSRRIESDLLTLAFLFGYSSNGKHYNMSHNVTNTFVNTTSAILLNPGYIKTMDGILKILQLIVGCLVIGFVGHFIDQSSPLFFTAELLLLLIATSCLITTTCLLVSCLLSISATTIISKTLFELTYHVIAFCLYLASSVYMLVLTSRHQNLEDPKIGLYALMTAGIFGVINTILYIMSFFKALCNQCGLYDDRVLGQRKNETTTGLL